MPECYIKKSIDVYTNFYKKLINVGAKIFITSFNIQEISKNFINNDYKSYKIINTECSTNNYKKAYRTSDSYKNLLSLISAVNLEILSLAIPVNDKFENFDCHSFYKQDIDFIDEYLCFLSKEHGCKLVTHDSDIRNSPFDIEVLTDNKNLLR